MTISDGPSADLENVTRQLAKMRSRVADLERERAAWAIDRAALTDAASLYSGIVDALPIEIAVLNFTGEIIAVNTTWARFAAENGWNVANPGVGMSYVDQCFNAKDAHSEGAREVGEAILSVLDGSSQGFSTEYACSSPEKERWFRMMTAPLKAERFTGAVVTHIDITERKMAEDRVAHQAQHDPLTGLPNRRLLDDRLKQAIALARRQRHLVAVLYLDLDGFKQVNDLHSHAEGDALLNAVAGRMRASLRDTDTLARTGGDEFTLVAGQLHEPEAALLVARKLQDELTRPFSVGGEDFRLSASIGISLYPFDGDDPGSLQRKADVAMYRAKQSGKNAYCLYSQ
jgi:diguanylate cyclase (GGDEF)-like protein